MSPTVLGFIKTSLVSVAIGVIMGVVLALGILPDATNPHYLVSAHAHIILLGAVMMVIFGVGYHILPRFSGRPLHNERLATVQLWFNIAGVAAMYVSFVAAAYSSANLVAWAVAPSGALFAIGALMFAYNIWMTISGALPAPTPLKPAGRPPAAK